MGNIHRGWHNIRYDPQRFARYRSESPAFRADRGLTVGVALPG